MNKRFAWFVGLSFAWVFYFQLLTAFVMFFVLHMGCGFEKNAGRKTQFAIIDVLPSGGVIEDSQDFSVTFNRTVSSDSVKNCGFYLISEEQSAEAIKALESGVFNKDAYDTVECSCSISPVSSEKAVVKPVSRPVPGRRYLMIASQNLRDEKGYRLDPYFSASYEIQGSADFRKVIAIISEVMSNPSGDEVKSEYIEVYNPGTETVDLAILKLKHVDGTEQAIKECGGTTLIKQGGFGLISGDGFIQQGNASETIRGCVKGRIGGKGLLNTSGQKIELIGYDNNRISSYGGWKTASDGHSIERVKMDGPDESSNWLESKIVGGSPGYNGMESGSEKNGPKLVKIDPSGEEVDPLTSFSLLFDQEVACTGSDACISICPASGCCESGKGALGGLIEKRNLGKLAGFTPDKSLDPLTDYWFRVSGFEDTAETGEMIVQCLHFRTGPIHDFMKPLNKLEYPFDGMTGVAVNLLSVQIGFSEPVRIYGDAIRLSNGNEILGMSCRPDMQGLSWTCIPPDKLECGTSYEVIIDGAVMDSSGNLSEPSISGGFQTGCSADKDPPVLNLKLNSIAPGGFSFSWSSGEPCAFHYEITERDSGNLLQKGGDGRISSSGTLDLSMDLETREYKFTGGCTDSYGNVGGDSLLFIGPGGLPPEVAINEVMANPEGADDPGEFIEILNYGSVAVDLNGWRLSRCGDEKSEVALDKDGMAVLPAGQYLLVVSGQDTGEKYPWGSRVIKVAGGPLNGPITNSKPEFICLTDKSGGLVSSFSGWILTPEGHSAERIDISMPDIKSNWIVSTVNGGTPAARNCDSKGR